jgi:hypothetical protein
MVLIPITRNGRSFSAAYREVVDKQINFREVKMISKKLIVLVLMFSVLLACSSMDVKKISDVQSNAAHDFTLPDQNGKMVKLSEVMKDYRGAVIAFYPKDDSKN